MDDRDVGFWRLVFPDFSGLLNGGVEAVTPILWFVILGLFLWAWLTSQSAAEQARKLVIETDKLISGVSIETFWAQRQLVQEQADKASVEVKSAWHEYNNTLVSDGRQVRGSLPAEAFFNTDRFAGSLFANRFLHLAPTALTTLGLLGTFLGLTVGLRGVNLGSTPDELRAGIQTLVHGAAIGFTASLWGVTMSLLINARLRWLERGVALQVRELQARIDGLLPYRSAEQTLSDIASDSADSKEALQVLHEKVGSALQEAVTQVGTSTRDAVTQAIHESLSPIMEELVETAANQSAVVFRDVSQRLTESFRAMDISLLMN